MARQKNSVDTVQITLSVTPAIRDFLEQLSQSGFYGKNSADTAAELLKLKLREISTQPGTPGVAYGPPGYPAYPVMPQGYPGMMPSPYPVMPPPTSPTPPTEL